MSEYNRTTRECTLDSMRPELANGIRKHIEQYELGDLASAMLICIETTSIKPKKGLFGKEEIIAAGILLTPQWLIWATSKSGEAPGVLSARLRNLEVRDYEKSEFYKMIPDSGINVLGQYTDVAERGSTFIGLGSESAAQKFRQMLKDAVRQSM
jgi:hypothetical protein